MMERIFAVTFSLGLLGAVASPAFRDPPYDSFPLSDYPMFSHGRPTPMYTMAHAVGVDSDGNMTPLPPMISAGNREVLQAKVAIQDGVRRNPSAFCDEIAQRVLEDDDFDEIDEVSLRTVTWDTVAYFASDEGSDERRGTLEREHARCPVPR